MLAHTSMPVPYCGTQRWEGYHRFKARLGCITSCRPDWAFRVRHSFKNHPQTNAKPLKNPLHLSVSLWWPSACILSYHLCGWCSWYEFSLGHRMSTCPVLGTCQEPWLYRESHTLPILFWIRGLGSASADMVCLDQSFLQCLSVLLVYYASHSHLLHMPICPEREPSLLPCLLI